MARVAKTRDVVILAAAYIPQVVDSNGDNLDRGCSSREGELMARDEGRA